MEENKLISHKNRVKYSTKVWQMSMDKPSHQQSLNHFHIIKWHYLDIVWGIWLEIVNCQTKKHGERRQWTIQNVGIRWKLFKHFFMFDLLCDTDQKMNEKFNWQKSRKNLCRHWSEENTLSCREQKPEAEQMENRSTRNIINIKNEISFYFHRCFVTFQRGEKSQSRRAKWCEKKTLREKLWFWQC